MADINICSDYSTVVIEKGDYSEDWNQYVNSRPSASVYHLPEWSKVLEESFGYSPFHLLARSADGKLIGILPLFLIKSVITGNRLVSLPFSYFCGPVADSNAVSMALIEEAQKLCSALKCHYLEIKMMKNQEQFRQNWGQYGFETSDQFSTFVLDLSEPELVWKKLDAKGVRWAIGKAKKSGVIVKKGSSIPDIKRFYKMNLRTKRRIGVPGHPECLFLNMFDKLGDKCTLYLAELQSKIIAGIITVKFNDTVLYAYAASHESYRTYQPNSLLVWTAIEDSFKDDYRCFDFGRTSPAEQNLVSFKKHWGAEEKALSYQYYPHIPNSMALNSTGAKYRLASSLWKKMPLFAAQICSNKIFGHLG